MARKIEEIIQSIDEAASQIASLSQLQSHPARASVWRYIKQVIAFVAHTLERMFDNHQAAIHNLLMRQQVGSLGWYAEQAKKYQHGHRISLIQSVPSYPQDSPSTKIVKHAAIEASTAGTVEVKVVKAGSNNTLEPLSSDELAGFQDYINAISFAGLRVVASSGPPVQLKMDVLIQINAQVITAQGKRLGTEKFPIKEALNAYLRALPFNGWIRASAIEDAIQAVEGVVDVHINRLWYSVSGRNYIAFSKTHRPRTGHALLATNSTFVYTTEILTG